MTDAPTPSPAPAPTPAPSPAPAPVAATRPEYVPEPFWDAQANAVKPEFGAHYTELATFHKTTTEAQAALAARKPDDIKIEVKLPETVKVPDGFDIKPNDKDPRLPMLREAAIKNGWSQDTVNAIVALDAMQKIADHDAEVQRVAAENTKLGANAEVRKSAVSNWAKGLLEAKAITPEEHDEIRITAATAAGISLLEKLIAKANGGVPGAAPSPPPKPADVPIETRWYGAQQKVS